MTSSSASPVRPYILAGGRSSRMGRDKAMLSLAGRTLLGRAVDTLRAVPGFADSNGQVIVTVVGERAELEGADRVLIDHFPGCGPLGGMEAAMRDLEDNAEEGNCPEWAYFVPVDMPFLPAGLIGALLREWTEAGHRGSKACFVIVDGTMQPLVSMMHKSLRPFLNKALTAGQFKVTAVLQSAAESLASSSTGSIGYGHSVLYTTFIDLTEFASSIAGWTATEEEKQLKCLWFSNLNSEEDFLSAKTSMPTPGSN